MSKGKKIITLTDANELVVWDTLQVRDDPETYVVVRIEGIYFTVVGIRWYHRFMIWLKRMLGFTWFYRFRKKTK